MNFDFSFAAIHSYLCADGYVIRNPPNSKRKYYYIGFRNYEPVLLADFEKKFKTYFRVQPRRMRDGRSVVQNKAIYEKITEEYSYYCKEWVFPVLSFKLSCIWLRAFYDCEGWVSYKKGKSRVIGIESANEMGLASVCKWFVTQGIPLKVTKRKGREIYSMLMYGKENLVWFSRNIGFLHPSKREKLRLAIKSYKEYLWDFRDKGKLIKALLQGKSAKRIRISSIVKENLEKLQVIFAQNNIHSIILSEKNNHSNYYCLYVNKRKDIQKLIALYN